MAPSDSLPAQHPLPRVTGYRGRRADRPTDDQAGEGLPSAHRSLLHVPRPLRRSVPRGCFQALHRFHGLRPPHRGSARSWPPLGGRLTARQTSLHAADRAVAPPLAGGCHWTSIPGVSPGTASQLPGSLAITRTGLAPAGNDELAMSGFLSGVTSSLLGIRVVRRHPHPVLVDPGPPL